jgi:rhamnose transport system substrate-binding protein
MNNTARALWTFLIALLLAGCGKQGGGTSGKDGPPFTGDRPRIGFMPKLTGIPYFNACRKGAEEAAQELNLDLDYNGPTSADAGGQIGILEQWATDPDMKAICVACCDPDQLARTLREAREREVPVITYDADTLADARDCFVNQATYDRVAEMMVDTLADQLDPKGTGQVGILTSSKQAPNQAEWAKRIKAYAARKYPKIDLLEETEHGENRELGVAKARALIKANKELKGILGLTSVAVPAAAEAVRQEKKVGRIVVSGVSTPRDMRDYVLDGTVASFVLWNPVDLGYLTVHVANLQRQGKMPKDGTIKAGRLGDVKVKDGQVLLGEPILFNRENIDKARF